MVIVSDMCITFHPFIVGKMAGYAARCVMLRVCAVFRGLNLFKFLVTPVNIRPVCCLALTVNTTI